MNYKFDYIFKVLSLVHFATLLDLFCVLGSLKSLKLLVNSELMIKNQFFAENMFRIY